MEILNKMELQNCTYNEHNVQPTVEIRTLKQGYEEEMIFRKNEIVFMMEGEVRFTFRGQSEKTQYTGEFVFIPVGGMLRYTVVKKTKVMIIRLNENVMLCKGSRIEEYYRQFKTMPQEEKGETVRTLKINPPLWHFLEGLNETVSGGLCCRNYFDTKVKELFILLKAYYSRKALQKFFSLILSPDTTFSEYIRANHHRYYTVEQLAASMNMTTKQFGKIFTRVFGKTPGKWLNEEKALMVYNELRSGTKPLKQIAYEYGFSTTQQLNRFCKRELSKNPSEIRVGEIDT